MQCTVDSRQRPCTLHPFTVQFDSIVSYHLLQLAHHHMCALKAICLSGSEASTSAGTAPPEARKLSKRAIDDDAHDSQEI